MKHETPTRRLIKARDAMAYLGVSRFTFDRLVHGGQLPVVMIGSGSKWLVDVRDLDAFIGRNKTTSPV